MHRIGTGILAWALCMAPAWGAHITQFSPQGEASNVESITLAFDQAVAPFGSARQADPVEVVCNDPAVKGEGRWLDAQRWTYVFTEVLGPGISCTAAIPPSFRTASNEAPGGKTRFSFHTGGPRVVATRPYGDLVDEDQVFVVEFNGAVDPQSVADHSQCLVEGLGESIPVRLITGGDRGEILQAAYYTRGQEADTPSRQLLQCKRRLPSGAKMQLRVGPGVATPGVATPDAPDAPARRPMASREARVFDYTVREAFKANLSCLRENAKAPCTPVSALTLSFSAPIPAADAARVRLATPAGEVAAPMDEEDAQQGWVSSLRFPGPFPELATLTLSLPEGLKDDAGRELSNADQFPLAVPTAAYPPLVKFSSSSFGVVERFGYVPEGGSEEEFPPVVPLTVRNVEAELPTRDVTVSAGTLRDLAVKDDREVLGWFSRVRRLQYGSWSAKQLDAIMSDQAPPADEQPATDVRGFSALKAQAGARMLQLPGLRAEDPRPFEVIGVPVPEPGFHVLEVESARLGRSLLENAQPMYVRTAVLVTNLAVHVKTGRDDMLAWVTTLDDGQVVPGADVSVLDCEGRPLAQGRTDEQGIWHHPKAVPATEYCEGTGLGGVYVSARIAADHALARGKADFSFAFSDWNAGMESWRFNVPTNTDPTPTLATHTVFDRSLFRAGETVSMKHYMRIQTRDGFALPPSSQPVPDRLVIEHQGSDQKHEQRVEWRATPSGGLSAISAFKLPPTAKLGVYTLRLTDKDGGWYGGGEFRVEEFKLPLLTGSLKISGETAGPLVAPRRLDADLQIAYVSGGPAGRLPVSVSGMMRDRSVNFPDHEDYSFAPPRGAADDAGEEGGQAGGKQALFLDKRAMTLDAQGGGRMGVDGLPAIDRPAELVFEAGYSDPNGQVQTLSQVVPVWPAALQAGIRAGSWLQTGARARISGLALTLDGRPAADAPIVISALARKTFSTRKRMVGGFYSYDNHTVTQELGEVCAGRTTRTGEFDCAIELADTGAVELIARVEDQQGRVSAAATTVWVTGSSDLWFGGENDDRIDVIPLRKTWKPGETAQFQVRMPFRQATALVAVEREGVLHTEVVNLQGGDPTLRIPIREDWGPNVYVSVLALRGRLRELPWHTFLSWGWKQPRAWYESFIEAGRDYAAPTPFVDLAKPAFRFGLASINVSDEADRLKVEVSADKPEYQVRGKARISIAVSLPDGRPAAHAGVAFAAVDEALLELAPNESWDLLAALRQKRSYGVETATAQMQVVGRRHFGRKALPAGGGGGKSPTRELLDTLLLWAPSIETDENGRASLELPLNDSITRFRLVAIADHGASRFGTGMSSIVSTQDLQVISGLPVLVREGDQYQADVTVRNATRRQMKVRLQAAYAGPGVPSETLPPQEVDLAPGLARTVSWAVRAPESNAPEGSAELDWTLTAQELAAASGAGGGDAPPASDRLAVGQRLQPAVPVRTQQASLLSLEAGKPATGIPVAPPKGALADANGLPRGGLSIQVRSSLGGGLPGVREWFQEYPYTCLEQTGSRAIGLRDRRAWDELMRRLPDYLDPDGLVSYFPGARQGNEVLTAYLLSVSHEAQAQGRQFAIPEDLRKRMAQGLLDFVQGKITRNRWAPQRDLDVRKLIALEALSRYQLVRPRMLGSMDIAPERWPTSAVLDWMALVQRVPGMPDQKKSLQAARKILRARMLETGTGLVFAADGNEAWWLMVSPETNLAKLVLVAADRSEWRSDMPLIAQGLLGLQRKGAWRTTTANLLGELAIEKFARRYESVPVTGRLQVGMAAGKDARTLDWSQARSEDGSTSFEFFEPWAASATKTLQLTQRGSGNPWVVLRSQAAVPVNKPVMSGYELARRVEPVSQAVPGAWTKGDVYRVQLRIRARTPTVWAVVTDPVPAGAGILGGGLGRDSAIGAQGEPADPESTPPSFVERGFESYRAYFDYLPAGTTTLEYTVRLNTVGQFQLPATRVEAMYQPDVFGELPNIGGMAVVAEREGQ
ncbi:alpha-2-macroglobulin family protein [Parapusillimonas granuli]|uniref:alpha-2-macroglobulin family protein n=1 Tax=Parapusillimonas granuli TaxID=380911 RepID=UPI0018031109|nr:hypothetical protein [Parapusillimonas granuli]MEB2399234.1 MG2 domain-containing protein [Alcaligenaceae bacterium]